MTPLRVAIVESSPLIRARLREALAEVANLEVVGTAEVEVEARTMLRKIAWDVVVLDLQLREGTGLGVLLTLATDRERQSAGRTGSDAASDVPDSRTIIVLTHFTFPQYRRKGEALGVHHFFDKARETHRVREVLEELANGPR
jgi:DNA-binding NarL/FixJ family response regulator